MSNSYQFLDISFRKLAANPTRCKKEKPPTTIRLNQLTRRPWIVAGNWKRRKRKMVVGAAAKEPQRREASFYTTRMRAEDAVRQSTPKSLKATKHKKL
jgi:hypothetical protein